ncbi:F0F1 ATP synthase subunit B [Aureimonas flava]|uniref:ATP synthase subunit b n=1 Tax=Aureimonas flava TaxID=2320271 RepID=A0A3A1WHL0_9HYPH|nr:F0F1 ATP synthase subunit B [Aureimonas flava]RIX98824.1 F0F1 ATP synthase subunit B [Aureimonas flava]
MFVTEAFAQTEGAPDGHGTPLTAAPTPQTSEAIGVPEGAHEAGGTFPPLNPEFFASQILWLAITFGVFYYVLSKTIVPRIASVLENRRERIAADLEAAERMRADADEAQAAYEQELASARANSQKIAGEARDSARSGADAERKRIEGELDAKLDAAQARIADIKARALADVDTIATEAAEAILTELTGTDVPREDVATAVRAVRA